VGFLLPENQSVCGARQIAYVKEKAEVAKVTFYIGGAGIFAVSRPRPDLLEVTATQASDGYCPENDCEQKRVVVSVPIPADAVITEALTDIEGPGKEHPFDCGKAARPAKK
jgi:hypothetical protein